VAVWCGWVLAGVAALTPLVGWLTPLGFAPLLALAGLLCLPAFRIGDDDRPLAAVLLIGLVWAAMSTSWSPFHPSKLGNNTALKLAFELALYWTAWCGARRAAPAQARLALQILAWGLAAFGALLLVETVTSAGIYRALRAAIGDPVAFPYARKNLAQASFVLALLWPVAAAAGVRARAPAWLAIPMALGVAVLARVFLADAPPISVALAVAAGAAIWLWPAAAPRVFGVGAAVTVLVTPLVVLGVRAYGLHPALPLSWSERVDYWLYAADRIADHPIRGWGLDASRAFGPHIQLHPHNGALQLWLELGLVGAAVGALVLAIAWRGLTRGKRDLISAGAGGSMAVYLLFGMISFGVWQEWWLALGAYVAVILALGRAAGWPNGRSASA
jgi:O-antigen ligase